VLKAGLQLSVQKQRMRLQGRACATDWSLLTMPCPGPAQLCHCVWHRVGNDGEHRVYFLLGLLGSWLQQRGGAMASHHA